MCVCVNGGEERKMNNKRCGLRSLLPGLLLIFVCDPAFCTGRGRIMGNLIVHDPARRGMHPSGRVRQMRSRFSFDFNSMKNNKILNDKPEFTT